MPSPLSNNLSVFPLTIKIVKSPQQPIVLLDDLQIHLSVTNNSEETVTLLQDPSGILSSRYRTAKFIVDTADGKHALPHFKGIKIKWSPQKAAEIGDTIVIGPGKTTIRAIQHDLSGTYDFSATGPGRQYTFTPKNLFYIVDPTSREVKLVKAATEPPAIPVKISEKFIITAPSAPVHAQKPIIKFQDIEFIGGSTEQHLEVARAIGLAREYIINCNRLLKAVSIATPHYETWFGAYFEQFMESVTSIYSNIYVGIRGGVRYDLTTCTDDTSYAYSDESGDADHPNRVIHLCPLFWSAPLTGIDSKAGTIVHELTHFKDYGQTWDYAYGVVGARELAKAARHLAVKNADSFEYFAESMGSKTASGLFFSNKDGFSSPFAVPSNPYPFTFTGKFNVAPTPFSSSDVVLIYKHIEDLAGPYEIQAGSIVRPDKIDIKLKNKAGKVVSIFAKFTSTVDTEVQVMGNGSWN